MTAQGGNESFVQCCVRDARELSSSLLNPMHSQDGGPFEERSCQCYTLLLPTTQLRPEGRQKHGHVSDGWGT